MGSKLTALSFHFMGEKKNFSSNSKNSYCNMGYTATLVHASAK
jgi:hypothetical protein